MAVTRHDGVEPETGTGSGDPHESGGTSGDGTSGGTEGSAGQDGRGDGDLNGRCDEKGRAEHGQRSGENGDGEGEPEQGVLVPDLRTRAQRQADGLTALARLAMGADAGTVRSEPPHVLILATPEQVTAAAARGRGGTLPSSRTRATAGNARPGGSEPAGPAESGAARPDAAPDADVQADGAQPGGDVPPSDTSTGGGDRGVPHRDGRGGGAQTRDTHGRGATGGGPHQGGRHDGGTREGGDAPAAGLAECVQTGPISPGTLGRFLCDAVLQAVVLDEAGAVLNLGRRVRSAPRAQRAALTARDRGCVIPGCPAPPSMCEPHHVREWSRGGPTDLPNLTLLCSMHHTAVHADHWGLTMLDGVPWAIPPTWFDTQRRPIRRRICDAEDHARKLGQQLRLDLELNNVPEFDVGPESRDHEELDERDRE
jgi:hypothetical protein